MFKENRIVIIIPFRNVENFITDCVNSILSQKFKNWIAVFCDDASTDDSLKKIPENNKFIIRKNSERMTTLPNIHFAIQETNLNEEDIIAILDGDDYLLSINALEIVNLMYQDDTQLTYGQFVYPNGSVGHCRAYTQLEFNNLRNLGFWASHMRTFKYKLYKKLIEYDPQLTYYKDKTGKFYTMCADVATMTPLMELAGFEKTKFNPIPIYFYRIHQHNDHFIDLKKQKLIADEIFEKNKINI